MWGGLFEPFLVAGYHHGPGSYDVGYTYAYIPSPQQQSVAQKQVNDYLVAVHKGRRRAATHRYIAVETLKPTKAQREDYLETLERKRSGGVPHTTPLFDGV